MPSRPLPLLLATLAGVTACKPIVAASPSHASLFGQVPVTFSGDFSKIGTIKSVTVGADSSGNAIQTYDLTASGNQVTATLQGAPSPGLADIVATGSSGSVTAPKAFTYDAPPAHVPLKWMAFGASLTQGFQSLGVTPHSQTHAVSADIARQAGIYLGLPLFNPTFLPPLVIADFDSSCVQTLGLNAGIPVIPKNPVTGDADLTLARLDPTLATPRDIAIGGFTLAEQLTGGLYAMLERVVEDPTTDPADIYQTLPQSQIDRLEAFDPDVAFSTDMLANDIDSSVDGTGDLDLSAITPPATLRPLMDQVASRLGKLHGVYFIANMPSLTFIPNVIALRAARIAAGEDTAESFDAKVAQIDSLTDQFNVQLTQALAPYPNLHIVDFHGYVEGFKATGVQVGSVTVTGALFDGVLSLDGLHFTDTGYALLANVFIDAMNPVLGSSIPHVDVEAVLAQDALSPASLRADGFTCVPPQ